MARPRLKGAAQKPNEPSMGVSIPVEGVVVRKEHVVGLLRTHLPQLVDIQAFEDGERFFLVFGQGEQHAQS